jgi:hypothetical protein
LCRHQAYPQSAYAAFHASAKIGFVAGVSANVTNKEGYEASGVDKLRDAIKASGAELIAGGYNKAITLEGDVTAANRF